MGLARGDILGQVEGGEVTAYDFVRLIALDAPRAVVPGRHVALRVEQEDCVVFDGLHQQAKVRVRRESRSDRFVARRRAVR